MEHRLRGLCELVAIHYRIDTSTGGWFQERLDVITEG